MVKKISSLELLKKKLSASSSEGVDSAQKHKRMGEVLVVDDEEPLLLSIAEGLSIYKKYFNLQTATNGIEAVKLLKSSPVIDLVITDLSMPKMDGFELLAYVNRNYPKIKVIMMTAFGTPKIEEVVRSMGLFRYLEKPLDINVIADNIFGALAIKTEMPENEDGKMEKIKEIGGKFTYAANDEVQNYYKKTMP
jgi:DNA-binding NtrC family response regulator